MSVEAVKQYLKSFGLEGRVQEFPVSSATVELAAMAVGVEPARIAKTLSFQSAQGGAVLIAAAGDAKVDNRKYKDQFGIKAKMLTADEVIACTGHAVGGVCPFAVPKETKVYLDKSLLRFQTVFPAAGSDSSAVELSCEELFQASAAEAWIDVCKGWEED